MKHFYLAFAFIAISYSTKAQSSFKIDTLQIYFTTHDSIHQILKDGLSSRVDDFIKHYNSLRDRKFVLQRTKESSPYALKINLVATRFVTNGQQVAATIISLIGLSTPVIMASAGAQIVVWFYYFPKTKSFIELSYPTNFKNKYSKFTHRIHSSPGFWRNVDSQTEKHIYKFDRFLMRIVNEASRK